MGKRHPIITLTHPTPNPPAPRSNHHNPSRAVLKTDHTKSSAPKGPRNVATGAAEPASSRAERNPWKRTQQLLPAPQGAEE
jgi:hypothetical protein